MMYRDVHHIIRPGTEEKRVCRETEDVVCDQVKRGCSGAWSSICFWMRGRRDQTDGLKLTLVVGVNADTRGCWSKVDEEIAEAVQSLTTNSYGVDIHIELLPGGVILC
jgi:hypothetical protein